MKFEKLFFKISFVCVFVYPTGESHQVLNNMSVSKRLHNLNFWVNDHF